MKNSLRFSIGAVTTLLACAFSGVAALPASAAATADAEAPQDCFVQYEDQSRAICFPAGTDMHQAIADATGLPVVDTTAATSDGQLAPMATVILGYIYDNADYGGGSLYFTTESSSVYPCSGYTYGFPSLGTYGWHDRASSMSGRSGCSMDIYENSNYGGAHYGPVGSTNYLYGLNDAGDSLVFGN